MDNFHGIQLCWKPFQKIFINMLHLNMHFMKMTFSRQMHFFIQMSLDMLL